MNKMTLTLGLALVAGCLTLSAEDYKVDASKLPPVSPKKGVTYDADIKSILEKSCVKCHSGEKPKGKYSMETLAGLIKGGKEGKGVVPGKSTESPVLLYSADSVAEMEMPPTDKRDKFPALTKDQLALVRAWIDQGAK